MMNLPNNAVFNKIQANNANIAPNATSNNTVVDHQNFSMLHPQRASESTLTGVLNQLDLNNFSQQTNGVLKGQTKDGQGDYMITPGVIKFKKGHDCSCDSSSSSSSSSSSGSAYSGSTSTSSSSSTTNYMA